MKDIFIKGMFFILTSFIAFWIFIPIVHGGNGSSGVGNASIIVENIASPLIPKLAEIKENKVIHKKNKKIILAIEDFSIQDFEVIQDQLVEAKLGRVNGFEYHPKVKTQSLDPQSNFWVICKNEKCYKFRPLIKSPIVQAIIGSLKRTKE